MGRRILTLIFLFLATAVSADWSLTKLNDLGVTGSDGKLVVLGTDGSWNDRGDTKEHVFDGNTSTFFDPPTASNNVGGCWAGIQISKPSWLTKIRYCGRSGNADRLNGCYIQGANTADFSDAVTLHVIATPSGWNAKTIVEAPVSAENPQQFTFFRIISPNAGSGASSCCGNCSFLEFYGYVSDEGFEPPQEPVIENAWFINGKAGLQWSIDPLVPQIYEIRRRLSGDDNYETVDTIVPAQGGGKTVWYDYAMTDSAEYKVRGKNPAGSDASKKAELIFRKEATGSIIASFSGSTITNAFDGDILNYCQASNKNKSWVGLRLERGQAITGVRYAPRSNRPYRMQGGMVQVANTSDFSDAVTLYTITETPPTNAVTEVTFETPAFDYQYIRYYSPTGYCSLAEISFTLPEGYLEGGERPVFSTPPGFYSSPVEVDISFDGDADIYYTTDGSTPVPYETDRCFKYTAPFTLSDCCSKTNRLCLIRTNPPELASSSYKGFAWVEPTVDQPNVNVIRARAFKNGIASEFEAIGTWLIGNISNQHTLRVVSLQTDEENFFADDIGLMVPGDVYNANGFGSHAVGKPNANYFQHGMEWERPVCFQLFESGTREEAFAQQLGVRNHGGYSRSVAQKTLRFYARKEYGKKKINYPLFGDRGTPAYKRFLLRNSGNDWQYTLIRDAVGQNIFRPFLKTAYQDYEPTVVYVNGEYWGIENFRDHFTKHYMEMNYGADPDNLDFLKLGRSEGTDVVEGDIVEWEALRKYAKSHDLSVQEYYDYMCRRIDVENMIDYFICEMYTGNSDWVDNNQGIWRERVSYDGEELPAPHDGRWRWMVYDTDGGLSNVNKDMYNGAALNDPLFAAMIKNPDYRNRFVTRCCDLFNSAVAPERACAYFDAAVEKIRSEMPRHIARWGMPAGSMSKWDSNLASIRSFLQNRPAAFRSLMASWFSLGELRTVSLAVRGNGKVAFNTLRTGDADGEIATPWSGIYYNGQTVTLNAQPAVSSEFLCWEINGEVFETPSLEVELSADTSITAVFADLPDVEYETPMVVVNDIMAEADTEDWFELFNAGICTVDLTGYLLYDDSPAHAYEIPAGVTLKSGEFLLVKAGQAYCGLQEDGSLWVDFGLGKKGDAVTLVAPDRTTVVDVCVFGAQTKNVSWGRLENGPDNEWAAQPVTTCGVPNRSPAATGLWLPNGIGINVDPGETLEYDFGLVAEAADAGIYTLIGNADTTATVSADGRFSWMIPSDVARQIYIFRVLWNGTDSDGQPAFDESTLVVGIGGRNVYEITVDVNYPDVGMATGGGQYEEGTVVTLAATAPTEGWKFVGWSDGFVGMTRHVTVKRNASYTALYFYDLDPISPVGATFLNGHPLVYWPEKNAAVPVSYVVCRSDAVDGNYEAIATVTGNVYVDSAVNSEGKFYRVAVQWQDMTGGLSAACSAYSSGKTRLMKGPVIGTAGSWNNNGDDRYKVFDGDTTTFFDSPDSIGWAGLDLGDNHNRTFTSLRYYARSNWASRMTDGVFQFSDITDGVNTFENPVTVFTVSSASASRWTSATLNRTLSQRYFRYLGPSGGHCNVAEIELYGYDQLPDKPIGFAGSAGIRSVSLSWTLSGDVLGSVVLTNGVPAVFVSGTSAVVGGLGDSQSVECRVMSLYYNGCNADAPTLTLTTLPPPELPPFVGNLPFDSGELTVFLPEVLDERLELVGSEDLTLPRDQWQPVEAEFEILPDGRVKVVIQSDRPKMFFTIRMRVQ
ncbi:MAG: CotH kinase family protein [Kiritimatiellae bacterium]|nr:CotH kinase family protein [Kiritimatiellia bacterium]